MKLPPNDILPSIFDLKENSCNQKEGMEDYKYNKN